MLTALAKPFTGMKPNTLTWIGFILSLLASYLIYTGIFWLLPIIGIIVFASSLFDALDGKVARMTHRTTKKGDFLDHVLDRYADVFLIGAIALSRYCSLLIGMMAIIGVLLTSYMGVQAQALGCGRSYHGILGRAERQVLLTITPFIQFALGLQPIWHFTVFEYVMLWFAVGGNITAIYRAFKVWPLLKNGY